MNKLLKIQTELKAPKGQFNKFGNYKYRSCEDILEALKPLLAKEGCTLTLSDEIVEIGGRVYVKATATLTDGTATERVTAYAREEESKKGMDASQVTGAASSYARKYALNGLFCIDDTKDADTDEYIQSASQTKATAKSNSEQKKSTAQKEQAQLNNTEIKEPTYRERVIEFAKRRNIPFTELAQDYNLNSSTTEERFKEVLEDLEG